MHGCQQQTCSGSGRATGKRSEVLREAHLPMPYPLIRWAMGAVDLPVGMDVSLEQQMHLVVWHPLHSCQRKRRNNAAGVSCVQSLAKRLLWGGVHQINLRPISRRQPGKLQHRKQPLLRLLRLAVSSRGSSGAVGRQRARHPVWTQGPCTPTNQ